VYREYARYYIVVSARRNPISWVTVGVLAATVASAWAQPRRPVKPVPPVMPLAPLELVWSVDLPFPPSAAGAMDATRIYVPLEGENLLAIERESGATRWRRDVESAWQPVIGGEMLIVAASDEVHALRADTGEGVWRSEVGGAVLAPLLVSGTRVVALATPKELVGFAADTGDVAWRRTLDGPLEMPELVADDRTGYLTSGSRVQAFSLDDGSLRWERDLRGRLRSPAVARDRVLVGSSANAVHALDARTGAVAWTFNTGGAVTGVAVDGDTVYAVSLDNLLRALNRSNGNQRWKQPLTTRPAGAPLPFIGLVAQLGYRPALTTFAAADGKPIGSYAQTSELRVPLLIDPAPRARRVGVVAVMEDGRVLGLRSVDLALREAPSAPLTVLPGRAMAREILPPSR
jgi:outer membrane protein assembly factor BamB